MPFLVYDLVPTAVLDAWHVIGKLVVLLWHTTIEDTEKYLVCGLRLQAPSLANLHNLGGLVTDNRGLAQRHYTVLSIHPHLETEVSLPRSPACLHSSLWTGHLVFDRALRELQPHFPPLIRLQQPPGS